MSFNVNDAKIQRVTSTLIDCCLCAFLPYSQLGTNTPGKREQVSDVWIHIRRLKGDNPLMKTGYKYVCVHPLDEPNEHGGEVCNHPLKLHRRSRNQEQPGGWVSTPAGDHLCMQHPQCSYAQSQTKKDKRVHVERVEQQLFFDDEKMPDKQDKDHERWRSKTTTESQEVHHDP